MTSEDRGPVPWVRKYSPILPGAIETSLQSTPDARQCAIALRPNPFVRDTADHADGMPEIGESNRDIGFGSADMRIQPRRVVQQSMFGRGQPDQ